MFSKPPLSALLKDLTLTILFGGTSVVLGMVQFQTPGYSNSYSDLREIALLISLFHLKNPLFTILISLVTLIGLPEGVPILPTFLIHAIPLFVTWFIFKWIESNKLRNATLGAAWFFIVVFHYAILICPILIFSYQWVGINTDQSFSSSYVTLLSTWKFELIATALVSSLYLIQHEIRKSLRHTNKNLEKIVSQRTHELTAANNELKSLNEKLTSSNEEINSLNENLEKLIKDRTEKINTQLNQLSKYAHMNSHEVRAPLARILGLLALLKDEKDPDVHQQLLVKMQLSGEELDTVIKQMNRLLEREID